MDQKHRAAGAESSFVLSPLTCLITGGKGQPKAH